MEYQPHNMSNGYFIPEKGVNENLGYDQSISMMNSLWNPGYTYTNDPAPLESEFRRLSLSSSSPAFNGYRSDPFSTISDSFVDNPHYNGVNASPYNAGYYTKYNNSIGANASPYNAGYTEYNANGVNASPYSSVYPEGGLMSMRAQSAARGQFDTQNLYYPSSLDCQNSGFRDLNALYETELGMRLTSEAAANAAMNRYSHPPPPPLPQTLTMPPRAQRNGVRLGSEFAIENQLNQMRNINGCRYGSNSRYRPAALVDNIDPWNSSASYMSGLNNGSMINRNRVQRQQSYASLEEVRGKIFLAAKDHYGCRFLQKKFEEGNRDEIHMIFLEVKDGIRELMVDPFGNYLSQKLFEVCDEEQLTQLLLVVCNGEGNLMDVCNDTHGTRAMQSLLEKLKTPEQRSIVVNVLRHITVSLAKSMNGHHVIQFCLDHFPSEDTKDIHNVLADHCMDIATDRNGCCVLQLCLKHAEGLAFDRLVSEITSNAVFLSEREFGNYVVQFVVGLKIPHATEEILAQLSGRFVYLSMDKFGSHVVERCLYGLERNQVAKIIEELTANTQNFYMIVKDQYGNYVAQSALEVSKDEVHAKLVNLIQAHYAFLHSHPHGKRVLAFARGFKPPRNGSYQSLQERKFNNKRRDFFSVM